MPGTAAATSGPCRTCRPRTWPWRARATPRSISSGTVRSSPIAGTVTGYSIFYRPAAGGGYTRVDISGAGTLGHTVTGLTNGTPYVFQVIAVYGSPSGEGPLSNEVTATPFAPVGVPEVSAVPGATRRAAVLDRCRTRGATARPLQYFVRVPARRRRRVAARPGSPLRPDDARSRARLRRDLRVRGGGARRRRHAGTRASGRRSPARRHRVRSHRHDTTTRAASDEVARVHRLTRAGPDPRRTMRSGRSDGGRCRVAGGPGRTADELHRPRRRRRLLPAHLHGGALGHHRRPGRRSAAAGAGRSHRPRPAAGAEPQRRHQRGHQEPGGAPPGCRTSPGTATAVSAGTICCARA